jgi:hypothetical protein
MVYDWFTHIIPNYELSFWDIPPTKIVDQAATHSPLPICPCASAGSTICGKTTTSHRGNPIGKNTN